MKRKKDVNVYNDNHDLCSMREKEETTMPQEEGIKME